MGLDVSHDICYHFFVDRSFASKKLNTGKDDVPLIFHDAFSNLDHRWIVRTVGVLRASKEEHIFKKTHLTDFGKLIKYSLWKVVWVAHRKFLESLATTFNFFKDSHPCIDKRAARVEKADVWCTESHERVKFALKCKEVRESCPSDKPA